MCLKYELGNLAVFYSILQRSTYDSTFENSDEGDMTKLSLVLDQEIRCCILWSSSILQQRQLTVYGSASRYTLIKFMNERCLDDLGLLGRSCCPSCCPSCWTVCSVRSVC